MRQRIATVLILVALAPFLVGGASAPPVSSTVKISGPTINAVVVINPSSDSSPTGDFASIWLQRGGATAGAVFRTSRNFDLGCNPPLMDLRFVNHRLREWIPTGGDPLHQGDILGTLFTALGQTVSGTNDPVIVDVSNVICISNPGDFPGNNGGYLSFQAVIQFAH